MVMVTATGTTTFCETGRTWLFAAQAGELDEPVTMRGNGIRPSGSWLKHQALFAARRPRIVETGTPGSIESEVNRTKPMGRALDRSEVLAPAELGVDMREA